MKTKDILQAFNDEARARQIPFKNFKLWTVARSRTIHVSCRHVSLPPLQSVADRLIFLHRGVRFMAVRVDGGIGFSYSSFCFKLGEGRK